MNDRLDFLAEGDEVSLDDLWFRRVIFWPDEMTVP